MAEDKILYAIHDRICFLKVIGEAKYSNSGGFDTFVNELFDRDEVDDVLVDLNETTYIDSTNLGELTKISTYLMQRRNRRPTLMAGGEEIDSIIRGLGLDRVFVMADELPEAGAELHEVPDVRLDERGNAMRILEAHRYLISLNETTGRVFRSVVDAFERELERLDHEGESE
jgi:anti-anti-sigma factor